ncbi:hypothetical protein [Lactococcus lactis]|uniref:hypothetical protein n=1 Tax=Lactococcus lactis TaxID=1358 RepID=UPI00288CE974|nr:hypothetical protein [Lactococcus lactis]MDT2914556.1 hypothetical protein [Lactococcus lactis]MDT2938692.1 hypothetical protein [Lactococcus lactis]
MKEKYQIPLRITKNFMYNKVSLNAWVKWINIDVKPFTLGSVIMSGVFFLLALFLIPVLGSNISVYLIICISMIFIVRTLVKVNDFDYFGLYDYKLAALYFLKPLSRRKKIVLEEETFKKVNFLPLNYTNKKKLEGTYTNFKEEYVRIYEVRGNASRMLFSERKNDLLANVKNFYNNLPHNVEILQTEVTSMHDVQENINQLLVFKENLKGNHIEAKEALIDEEIEAIKKVAAKTKKQYFIAISTQLSKLDELEDLMLTNINEDAYFSYCRQILDDEFETVVKEIFLLNPAKFKKRKKA